MILRDPVHGLIDFEGRDEKTIETLLHAKEVQRLRRVRQLGLTSLVFPGAEHSRFSHALGAAHIMVRLQDRLAGVSDQLPADQRIDAQARQEAIAAAFLHDLGHGPFSHLFEQVAPGARHHEEWTRDVLVDPSTEVHRALESLAAGAAARVAALLSGEHEIDYLPRLVSGKWDVDRADYLLRDSHMTGVRYGLYDLDWLLRSFSFGLHEPSGEWVLAVEGRKGLPPIEAFFLGRNFMYQQVYHHKATRAAETLIRGLLARLSELVQDGTIPEQTPAALTSAARGDSVTLSDYFDLDDSTMLSAIAAWSRGGDPMLAQLAGDLLARRLPKTLPLPDDENVWALVHARVQEIAEAEGGVAPMLVHLDVARDVPYDEPEEGPGGLFVDIRHRDLQRLGDASFLLQQLRGKVVRRPRLVFPRRLRDKIQDAAGELLDGRAGAAQMG